MSKAAKKRAERRISAGNPIRWDRLPGIVEGDWLLRFASPYKTEAIVPVRGHSEATHGLYVRTKDDQYALRAYVRPRRNDSEPAVLP